MKGFLKQLIGKKMSDKSLILTIGLTDAVDNDNEWIVHAEHKMEKGHQLYNLYKQNPEVEKASLSWKLNMNNPLIAKLIYQWEETIRKPHLKMVTTHHTNFHFNKEYLNMFLDLEHIPLLPGSDNISMTNKEIMDYDLTLAQNVTWGSLKINVDRIYDFNNAEFQSFSRQIDELHTTEKFVVDSYDDVSNKILDIPLSFSFNLELSQMKRVKPSLSFSDLMHHQKSIFAKYESELSDLGYDKELYANLLTSEVIVIGEPQESASILYDTFSKYPTVCRTSLTKEE
jgi:hypothetical protein